MYGYDSIRFHSAFLGPTVQTNIFDSSVTNYKRSFFEIGAGYFFKLNKKKTITYNLYPGIAFGKFAINDAGLDSNKNNYTRFYNANFTKWYLMGAFNFMPSTHFNFSVGGKFSWLRFNSINTSYVGSELYYFYLDKINDKTFFVWEPFINLQFGVPKLDWLKVDGQLSFTTTLDYEYPKVRTFNGSIGLTFNLTKLLKNKK